MITVAGATGNVGASVVRQLVAQGVRPTALVRDAARATASLGPAVTVAKGDMSRPETLPAAFEGSRAVFLASPDVPGDEKLEMELNVLHAAEKVGVARIVYLSAPGAGSNPEFAFARWHQATEKEIEASGLAWTHLRPIAFMTNLCFSIESIRADGAFYLPAGEGRVSVIDPNDIATVATEALTGDLEGESLLLTGPEALSHAQQATQLAGTLGRSVRFVDIDEDTARAALSGHQHPAIVDALLEFYRLVKDGRRSVVSQDFERVTGRRPRTFAQWASANVHLFA